MTDAQRTTDEQLNPGQAYGYAFYLRHMEEHVRQLVKAAVQRNIKVGCKNFQMRGGMYCGNCGYHYDEH